MAIMHYLWWLYIYSSGQRPGIHEIQTFQVKFDHKTQNQSTIQNNKNLNQGVLHLWSKFGDRD